jgi:hypothetical protein
MQDASCKEPVHLALAADLSQMSFFLNPKRSTLNP